MSFTLAAQSGWSSDGLIIPKVSFPIHNDIHPVQIHTLMHVYKVILRRGAIHHHGSILLFQFTAIQKSEMVFSKFELCPLFV